MERNLSYPFIDEKFCVVQKRFTIRPHGLMLSELTCNCSYKLGTTTSDRYRLASMSNDLDFCRYFKPLTNAAMIR